jgi:hypothetical protein
MATILTGWAITQQHSLDIQFKEVRQYSSKTFEIKNLPKSYAFDFRALNFPITTIIIANCSILTSPGLI